MKQKLLFEDLMVALEGDGRLKSQSTNPLAVRGQGDISGVADAVKDLELQLELKLPQFKHEIINTRERLEGYLKKVLKNKVIAMDTETNPLTSSPNGRLDPIAGFSIYTPGETAAYIPINHNFYEGNLDARFFFRRLKDKDKEVAILMHNSNYDVPVIDSYAQVHLRIQSDTMVASRVLNENERNPLIAGSGHGLKYLWNKYCMNGNFVESSYASLFNSRGFGTFNPDLVYKYATLDAIMTYQLASFQMKYLSTTSDIYNRQPDLKSVSEYYWNIEMPALRIAQEMSREGINYDLEANMKLQKVYEGKIKEILSKLYPLTDKIMEENAYRVDRTDLAKLTNPINYNSAAQLSVLFYKVMGMEINESLKKAQEVAHRKRKGAGPVNYEPTGADAIAYFHSAYPEHKEFLDLFVEYRDTDKIYSTFIVKYREYIDKRTGKIHAEWKTTGADTGRMSCSGPNLYTEVVKLIKLLGRLIRLAVLPNREIELVQ